MSEWFRPFLHAFPLKKKGNPSVRSILACTVLGQPVWTPRQFSALADEGYQKNVIVYRCINLIAKSMASIPWSLYQQDKKGIHELVQHPWLKLMAHPNPQQGRGAFLEAMVGYLLLSGNSFIEVLVGQDNKPLELYPLRPDRMRVIAGAGGIPQGYEYSVGSSRRQVPVDPVTGRGPILHLKNFHPLNDWYGMSPLEAAAQSVDQHNAVSGHNLALLQNGGRPSGALLVRPKSPTGGMTEEQRESLRQDVKGAYEGTGNAGRIMILEGDFEWKEMGLSPKDLDFVEGKNISAREIAQAFGVPSMLVGVPGDSTFANYKEARFHLWEDTILPLFELILSELNHWLKPYYGEDVFLDYDPDAIPALAPRREAIWTKINSASFLTINEKREALGYTPLDGGDKLFNGMEEEK